MHPIHWTVALSVLLLCTVLIIVIIVFYYRSKSKSKSNMSCIHRHYERPFQLSPEYRYPTKCFDCVDPQHTSQQHWNLSSGLPMFYVGM
jgi:hypothetical protein